MAIGNIIGGLGALGGAIMGNMGRRQQQRDTKELMQIQQFYNQQNMEKAQQQQFEMWQKTNFPAQVEMLKNAGLNVGLMYEGGGAGGTTGAGNMTSAGLGNAPNYDIAGDMAKGGALAREVAQLGLLKAQRENIEADTQQKQETTKSTAEDVKYKQFDNDVRDFVGKEATAEAIKWANDRIALAFEKENAEWETLKAAGYEGKAFDDKDSPAAKALAAGYEKAEEDLINARTNNDINEAKKIVAQFEARMAQNGIHPNSPWYVKLLGDLLEKAGIVKMIGKVGN